MYEVNIPAKPFTASTTRISIPEYVRKDGGRFSCSAVIYKGTPYLRLSELCVAIAGGSESCARNCQVTLKTIITKSRFGNGSIIVTPRGIFADPLACKAVLASYFGDASSPDRNAAARKNMLARIRSGATMMRQVVDADLYEAIQLFADELVGTLKNAKNQINPKWLKVIDPTTLKSARNGVTGRELDITDDSKEPSKTADTQESKAVVNASEPESAAEPVDVADRIFKSQPASANAEAAADDQKAGQTAAGIGLPLSKLFALSATPQAAQTDISALVLLVKELAAGKTLSIKISLD